MIVQSPTSRFAPIFVIAAIAATMTFSSQAGASTFEERRDEYLNGSGSDLDSLAAIWAWLENNDASRAEEIHGVLEAWRTVFWRQGWDLTMLEWMRVWYQYADRVDPAQLGQVEDQFDDFIRGSWGFHTGTLNNRLFDFVVRYLWSQNQPEVTVQYGEAPYDPEQSPRAQLDEFVHDGREYILANTYNSLELSRDWLYWTFDNLTSTGAGNEEMDSEYTKTFVISLYTLYDFAHDPEMKSRARMMLDFLLLDSILDVGANLHGGHIGRSYAGSVLHGHPQIFHWIYWGIGPDPNGSLQGQFYDAYVSAYRLPALIEDLGILDDEPDEYWHMHKENNRAGFLPSYWGKWTYVTRYYTLGGSPRQWMLNVKSSDSDYGIRMWINTIDRIYDENGEVAEVVGNPYAPMTMGEGGSFQYKNVMVGKFMKDQFLHIVNTADGVVFEDGDDTGDLFDLDETENDRRFLREGGVAMCVHTTFRRSAIEVAIIGTDYPSYDEFRTASLDTAGFRSGDTFTTSKGDVITPSWNPDSGEPDQIYVNSQPLWEYPFERMETGAFDGEDIVSWDNRIATVRRHGLTIIFDFNNWTSSEGGAACAGGETRACYTGRPGTEGVGVCRSGEQTCAGEAWGSCEDQVLPVAEVCDDGLDNDCDGHADGEDRQDCGQSCADLGGAECAAGEVCEGGRFVQESCCVEGACVSPVRSCADRGGELCAAGQICEGGRLAPDWCCVGGACADSTEPNPTPEEIVEAEDADIESPMQAASDDTASGGNYVFSPDGGGSVSFTFDVAAGDYRLRALVRNSGPGENSFFVGLDGEAADDVEANIYDEILSLDWIWDDVRLRGPNGTPDAAEFDPMVWPLPAGAHTFTFYGREVNAPLDAVQLLRIGEAGCSPGTQRACYSGAEDSLHVGPCTGGIETCSGDGAWAGGCDGETVPALEVCGDDVDNDCDGLADEKETFNGCSPSDQHPDAGDGHSDAGDSSDAAAGAGSCSCRAPAGDGRGPVWLLFLFLIRIRAARLRRPT